MTLRTSALVALSLGLLVGCGSMVAAVPDGATQDSAAIDAPTDAPSNANDAVADRAIEADTGVAVAPMDSGVDAPSAVDASMDSARADATDAGDAAADAAIVPPSDACVADGGNASLRFGEVYRRTINDGGSLGGGCTTSSRCHGRPGEVFDLSSESAAYASLLGVMGACGVRVTPCDLSRSYISTLMHRPDTCRGQRHTGFGQTMTAEQIALLDAWILGGAQR
ncbi:MAG: hypothetical protein JNK05_11130 [Myxococcales bacterium]|nr:hypothetical protein [Myxococcales bacterium]